MKKRRSRRDTSDPIAEYQEWAENRYNPGYWTGAKTPPNVKSLWSTKDRHWLGVVFIAGGAFAVVSTVLWARSPHEIVVPVAMGLGGVVVGFILLFSRDNPKKKKRRS